MRRLRCAALKALIVSIWLFTAANPVPASASDPKARVLFNWAFGALVGDEAQRRLVGIVRDTKLTSGDQFKMLVELKEKCFVYVIYYSGQGEIQLLFPGGFEQFSENYQVAEKYYIPQGDLWFALDEKTGLERFYLLASAVRLENLEALLGDYETAEADGKTGAAENIVAEIKKLKRKHRKLHAAAERPVSIGGTVRGGRLFHDVAAIAVEFSAAEFFSRTFTIEHQ